MIKQTEEFYTAIKTAADLDAFTDENIESEYTRGIVELIINALMNHEEDEDLGSDYVRDTVANLGRLYTDGINI